MSAVSPRRSAPLAVAWCAWALVFFVAAVAFDLAASTYFILLLVVELALASRSYQVTGRRVFLLLLLLPALPLLAVALPSRFGADVVRLMAVAIPPLVAVSVVTVLSSERLRAARGFRSILTAVGIAALALGVRNIAHPLLAPALDTPAGRALVAGCYRVTRGRSLPNWTSREWPPAVARFDTARWVARAERFGAQRDEWNTHLGGPYWGQAMIQSPGGTPGWWRPLGPRSISVNWTHGGLGGFRGTFRLAGDDLVGAGEWFQDMVLPIPLPPRTLAVRMTRIDCSEMR